MNRHRCVVPLGPRLQLTVEKDAYGFLATVYLFASKGSALTTLAYCYLDHSTARDSVLSAHVSADDRGGKLWLCGTCFHIPAQHVAKVCQTLGLAVPPPLASSDPDGVPGKVVSPASLDAGSSATEVRQCSSAT